MAPDSGLDANHIKDQARKGLLDLLEGVRGKKNLVVELSLAASVGILIKFSTLQDHGVDKVFLLENDNADTSQKNIIFLTGGEKASQSIAVTEQIKRLQSSSKIEHEFTVIWVPRRTLVCNKIMEEAGVLGDVVVQEFPLRFIPLEEDLLSLCLEDSFSDLYLRKDPTCIFLAAQALMTIQQAHGLFPRIIGKGDNAHRLMELLLRMRTEALAEESSVLSNFGMMPSATIDSLIVIDREIDFATPLLTQLTYEGLIDEMFGIKHCQTEIDMSIVGPAPGTHPSGKNAAPSTQKNLKRKIQLDSTDKLYEQIRDANGAIVDGLLNKAARRLQSDMESRHTNNISELRDFVGKLPGYQNEQQSLKIHIHLIEEIMKNTQSDIFRRNLEVQQNLYDGSDPAYQHETIEDLISRDVPLPTILRLVCLESCISGGLRPRDLDNFKRLILHAYGYQHLLTLASLEKTGLLQTRTSANVLTNPLGVGTAAAAEGTKTNYNYLRKQLRLVVDEINEHNPNDIAYVYSGYAPLTVRLVQAIIQKSHLLTLTKGATAAATANSNTGASQGWQGFEDALRNIRGATFNKVQKGDEAAVKARHMLTGGGTGGKAKTVLVMFLGGITYTEMAALRFVGRQMEGRRRVVVCTTDVVSGGRIMEGLVEKRDFGGV